MHNFTFVFWNKYVRKSYVLWAVLLIGSLAQAQIGFQSPSITTGVTFQWEDSQTIGGVFDNDNPATIESVTIDGTVYNSFAIPSAYQLTRLGPAGNGTNNIWLNGSETIGTSVTATQNINDNNSWDDEALNAFQSPNLNYYFEASAPQGDNICLDFDAANGINGAQETDSQMQTLFYDPPLPANEGGVLAVTERGGNNCLYVRFFGFLPGSTTETTLGDTFVRTSGNLTGGGFSAPANGSDYWGSGREQDNKQTIAIGLFQLNNVAPTGSKITRIRFIAASNDHGDGKVFVLQRYAQPQVKMGCIDETIDGQIDNASTVPAGSMYTLMGGPNPSGTSFTLNTDGSYQYIPQPGFVGDVTFEYKVQLPFPNQNITDTNTVTITIHPNPDEAVVQFTCGNTANTGFLNITAPLGAEYEYALDAGAFQSTTQFDNIGVGTYIVKVKNTQTECVSETSYTVDDADNAAPVAFGEDFSTGLNQSITFNVLVDNGDGLDFDPDGDPFSIISNTQPTNGSFVNNGNGSFTFTPNNGFVGSTFFTYTIEDDPSPCTNLKKTDTATVTIHVVADPDPRDCDCTPLYKSSNFVNPQLIEGQSLSVGAVYRFSDVFPANPHGTTLDALVRIEEFAGGASLLEIDVTSSGLPEAFQPRINSTNNNDQSVLFSMTFVESGGSYGDEVEISFYGTPLDIDGDNVSTREYAELSLPDAYFVSNNTFLDITQTATEIRGESTSISVAPGDDVSLDPRYTYSNYWQTESSLTYRIGKLDGDSDRYYSFNVSCADFIDPEAVFITNPVICGNVSDEQGNPLANVSVDITGSDGSSETVITDANGDYKKEVVIPNPSTEVIFEILENDLPGYVSISDVDGANDNLITRTISLESSCGNDFVDGFEVILTLVTKTDILCNGENTGSITVTTSGGVPPYMYTLNGGAPQSSPIFNNLVAGNYNIIVTDTLGNTDSLLVNLEQPEPLNIELTKTNATATALCNNGTATATVTGGTGMYTYQWDDPLNQTTATATGLSASLLGGTQYTVVVTDENGCIDQQSIIITCVQDCDAVISVADITNVLCKDENTGSATVSASSAANPGATFTFTWDTTPPQVDAGVTTSTISNQFAGVYTASVTIDGTLCQPVEESVTITEPSTAVAVTATATDETGPTTNDGTATANPSGGIPGYTYLWNTTPPQTTQTITGLSDGTYTVTVTDANGCEATTMVTVNNGTCNNLSVTASSTPVSCNGGNDGTATANPSGGLGNFTYVWSPGGQTTQSISGLTAGVYIVTVKDTDTKCIATSSTTVNEPTELTSGIAITNVSCFGESTGSLDLTVAGGTPGPTGYTYLWSPGGQTTQDISNLAAGTYSVLVTDANGCTLTDQATVGQPSEALDLAITAQTDIVCETGLGSVTVQASGGTAPYTYTLDGGAPQASGTFNNLAAGTYTVAVVDTNVCSDSVQVTILENCTIAVNDFRDTVVNVPIIGNVLINDEDLENDNQVVTTLTVTSDQGVVVNILPDGTFTYTPPLNYVGGDFFMYSIEDDGNPQATDSATVFIRINPVNVNNTIANADAVFTEEDVAISGNVLTNDVDIEGDTQTVTNPGTYTLTGGVLVLNADGTFIYTPNPGFTGTDTFIYDIIDDNVNPATDSAVLTITVLGDPIVNYTFAVDDGYGGNQGATITGNVLDNDFDPEGNDQFVDIAISPSNGPTNGTVTLNMDGSFSYTPNDPNFFGNDSFVYSIFDNGTPLVATDQATVSILISGENLILAIDDINNTYVGLPVNGNVATNDDNYDGPAGIETFTLVSGPTAGGILIFNADGTYNYSPPADPLVSEDTFVYQICDAGNPIACDTATVYIEILPIPHSGNEPPVANADTNTTEVDTPVNGFALPNDFDPDGDMIVVTANTSPANGNVVINPDGSYIYTPAPGFIGEDSFMYTICDDQTPALCDTTTVTIQVIDNNGNITVANDDAYNGIIDTVISGNVLDNDTDPEGDDQEVNLAVSPLNGPTNGTVSLNADGSFTYTPNGGFVGTDSFVYEIFDNNAQVAIDQATVYLTVGNGVNEILAIDDINDTFVNLSVDGSVATNDINTDGPTGTEVFTLVTSTSNGTLTFNPDGSYTYEPGLDYVGEDTFVYQVCDGGNPIACDTATVYIEVQPLGSPGNEPPVANADTNSTQTGVPVDGNVLPNDFDPDDDPIVVTANTDPSNGSVVINPDGTYTYTPDPGFTGEDTFTYTICDDGLPIAPALCDTATVTIQVLGSPDNITTAVDDAYYGFPDTDIVGNVLDNDTDPENDNQTVDVAVSPSNGPSNGTVVLNADGSFTYTPGAGFEGTDSFVYEIFDNNADVATDVATVYISIADPGNEILAVDDINDTFVDLPVSGNVATNDENFDGPMGTEVFTLVNGPTAGGTLTFNPDGTYDYIPAAGFVGKDTFVYQVCDGGNPIACDTATVTISIVDDPIIGNDPPVANNDVNITEIDIPVDGNVLVNDFDPDLGDTITVTANTNPTNGSVTIAPNGDYTYTPNAGFEGVDTFEYTICDSATPALCDTAIVTIYVIGDPGNITVANDDAYYGEIDAPVVGNVLDNDSDPELNSQELNVGVTPVSGPSNGTVTVNSDGSFEYTPGPGFTGNDQFVYEIFDNGGPVATDQATVYILIAQTPAPAIAIVKSGVFVDGDGDMCSDAGELINYTFTVTNEGNVPLFGITVTDPLLEAPNPVVPIVFTGGDTDGDLALDVDETWTYTASYAITQIDIDAGEVVNQATATGTDADGTVVDDLSDESLTTENDPTVTTLCQSPVIAIVKTGVFVDGNGDQCANPGESIDYTFTVTNEGNVSLTNITVTDPLLEAPNPVVPIVFTGGDTDGDLALDVDEIWTYTASYAITQVDIDAGEVVNQATATGTAPDATVVDDLSDESVTTEDDPTITTLCQSPVIAIVKTGVFVDGNGDQCADPGESIDYTFTVTNEGNVSLTNITVTDPLLEAPNPVVPIVFTGGDADGDLALDVDETWTYTASYAITQVDIDAGEVVNQATATGTAPDATVVDDLSDESVTTEDDPTITTLCQSPVIAIVKAGVFVDGNGDQCANPGESIDYTFTVTNEGNVSLTNITVTDPLLEAPNPVVAIVFTGGDTDGDLALDVDEIWTYTASYAITQVDIDAGEVINQATATGTAPDGTVVDDLSDESLTTENDPTVTTLCQSPSIALIKIGTLNDENGNGCSDVDETISYEFQVRNTGNVTLTAVDIDDLLVNVVGGPIVLAPGQTDLLTFTAVYSINQIDIDNGSFENQAVAMGTAPDGTVVEDDSDFETFIDDRPTITVICQNPSIALIKVGTVMDENGSGCADPKETIEYAFSVRNTGNVTITNIDIDDPLVNVVGGPITLAPGQTDLASFTATYLITQANINDGFVENQAVASGLDPQSNIVSDDSDFETFVDDRPTITQLCQGASIALIKTANPQDQNGDGCVDLGESIIYEFVVKNTGNVVLSNITVTDPLVAVTGGPITLNPLDSDSDTFRAEYFITQEDVDNGFVMNQATAEGTAPDGTTVIDLSDDDSFDENDPTELSLCQDPKVSLEKTGVFNDDNGDGAPQVGETISYVFSVENTGNVVLFNLELEDDLEGVVIEGGPIAVLEVGEIDDVTFSATYAITEVDIENGEVVNQAVIRATTSDGSTVEDTSDDPNDLTNTDINGDGDPDDPTVTFLPNVGTEQTFEIFNGVTPDGDGLNDFFRVVGIENFPDNNMQIFNRWGILVYETDGYGGATGEENVFRGFSEGRVTIRESKILPTGTYFYVLVRQDPNSDEIFKNSGYLYINR